MCLCAFFANVCECMYVCMHACNRAANLYYLGVIFTLFGEPLLFFSHILAHFTLFGNGFDSILLFLAHFY